MVLDDATTNLQDGWTENAAPTAETENLSVNPSTPFLNAYNIDVDKLPRPIFFSRGLRQAMTKSLDRMLANSSKDVKRPLTQPEAEALCYINSKGVQTLGRSGPLLATIAAARCYQTSATFRFPLYQPNPTTFNPNSFLGVVNGSMARRIWHGIRLMTYSGTIILPGMMLVIPYISTRAVARIVSEPRLKQFNEDVVRTKNAMREQMMQEQMRRRAGLQRPGPSQQGQTRFPSAESRGTRRVQDDNMSPTSNDYTFSDNSPAAETGTTTDSPSRFQGEQGRSYQQRPFDSSSPDSTAASSDDSGGSAWDRIRAQGTNASAAAGTQRESAWAKARGNASEGKGENKSRSTVGDSFAFSSAEEDREAAKSEAQKDFDARLERERSGKDF